MRRTLLLSFAASVTAMVPTVVSTPAAADGHPREAGELLDTAQAHEAALRIACSSEKARRYYAGTLRDLEQRRWGLLRSSIADDTIALAGDAVYDAARRGHGDGEAFARFIGASRAPDKCTTSELEGARRALAESDRALDATAVSACASRPIAERREDPACALALAARSALDGDEDLAREHLADLVATLTFDRVYDGKVLSSPQRDELFRRMALSLRAVIVTADDDDPTIFDDVTHAFGAIDLDEVHPGRCKDGELVKDLAHASLSSQDAFCLATRPDLDLTKVAAKLTGPTGEAHVSDLEELVHITQAFERGIAEDGAAHAHPEERDERIAEALLCSVPLTSAETAYADCTTGAARSTKAGTFKLTIGGESWDIAVSGRGAATRLVVTSSTRASVSTVIAGGLEALHVRSNIEALVGDELLGEEPAPEAVRELAAASLRLRRVAAALDRVPVESNDDYFMALIDALPAIAHQVKPSSRPGPKAGGAAPPPDTCAAPSTAFDRIRCVTRHRGALRPLLVAAEQQRVRDLALRAGAAFVPSDDPRPCGSGSYGRLFTAVAAQLPEEGEAAPDALAAQQLRSAAGELSRCEGAHASSSLDTGLEWIPSPALRASWNSAYVNAWGGDGFRVAPSLDALIARVRLTPRASRSYVGLQGSVVDLFAPLSELAMRRGDLRYDGQSRLFIELLRPRVEVTVGLPALSRHVLLSGGFSLRTVAPFRGADGVARYRPVWSKAAEASEGFAGFIEYNLGAKYVF